VGRGTDTPFEVVGAPYIDDLKLAARMNTLGLQGVRFVPVRFTPKASVFQGKECGGVNIILTDRNQCSVVDVGISMAQEILKMYPADFVLAKFNNLLVHPPTIDAIQKGGTLAAIKQSWAAEISNFQARREKYLLYK
jgi:uncharacterized protein YbbC (DUF1343 family)